VQKTSALEPAAGVPVLVAAQGWGTTPVPLTLPPLLLPLLVVMTVQAQTAGPWLHQTDSGTGVQQTHHQQRSLLPLLSGCLPGAVAEGPAQGREGQPQVHRPPAAAGNAATNTMSGNIETDLWLPACCLVMPKAPLTVLLSLPDK
jgi:hypothetical protein